MERRLAAVLAADVVGYSRLMGADETGTLVAVKALRAELFAPTVAEHRGRIVKLMGDGALVEFPSVVQAVECALAVQRANAGRNEATAAERRIDLRIGVNLGDVIVEGDDIYGDGVNIAARLEALAEPGGIAVSGAAHDHVAGKVDVVFADAGVHELKNIAKPVRVYRWSAAAATAEAGVTGADHAPLLPDKPSIAVLPFTNMSGDPEQEYFADGITEDIITELSRFQTLFVIARNSTFVFKGQGVDIQEIGRNLGVQYVVEGSVRKSGQRVRVTAQLVEAESGKHVWAERYDRDLDDLFAVQDEITQAIVSTLPGRLEEAGWERAKQKPTSNMTAYDYVLLGLGAFNRFSREDNLQARRMFRSAIDLDPLYARAHALLASTYIWDVFIFADSDQSLDQALESAEAALALDDEDGWSHAMLGFALFLRGEDEDAQIHFQRSISLNPNDADAIAFMADVLIYFGRWEEGLEAIDKAKRINPFPPVYYHWFHALALYSAREYDRAILIIKRIRPRDSWHRGLLGMCYAQVNRLDEAKAEIAAFVEARRAELREQAASLPASDLELALPRVNRYRVRADRDHFLEGLRKAGLSE